MQNGKPMHPNYRKPPTEHQFQKGHSGNPRGRPKGSKSLATIVDEELSRIISMVEDGKTVWRPVREALLDVLITLAIDGNQKAIDFILEVTGEAGKPDDAPLVRMVVDGLDVNSSEHQARQARRKRDVCDDPEFSCAKKNDDPEK